MLEGLPGARQPVGYCTAFGYSSLYKQQRLQFLSISKQKRKEVTMVEQKKIRVRKQVQIQLYDLPVMWPHLAGLRVLTYKTGMEICLYCGVGMTSGWDQVLTKLFKGISRNEGERTITPPMFIILWAIFNLPDLYVKTYRPKEKELLMGHKFFPPTNHLRMFRKFSTFN